jgi:hypothetical protein
MSRTPRPIAFLPTTILFLLLGGGGLYVLFTRTLPTLGPRWLFFFLIVVAVTGLFLPIAAILNARFPTNPPAGASVIVREALWVGVYAAVLAWLQYGRVFSITNAVVVFVGFMFIEAMIRLWERTWRRSRV